MMKRIIFIIRINKNKKYEDNEFKSSKDEIKIKVWMMKRKN
jgi:hypothetical protein